MDIKRKHITIELSEDDYEETPLAPWQGEASMILLILAPQVSPYEVLAAFKLPYPPIKQQPIVLGHERACNIFANNGTRH
jgi:hypothetical protein